MPERKIIVDAILFDMDGTLIDSTPGVIGAWEAWGRKYPDLDVQEVLRTSHGVRTIDNLRKWCPDVPEDALEAQVHEFEMEIVKCSKENEAAGKTGIVMLPGVTEILPTLKGHADWAVCTSATHGYARAALGSVNIPVPENFVASEDVTNGKPHPEPYLRGAEICKVNVQRCLVVEDAPSGIASGKAAGAKTLAVCTSHSEERMIATQPDFVIRDLTGMAIERTAAGIEVTLDSLI